MRARFSAGLIGVAAAFGLATAAHAQTGAEDDGLNCNQATVDGGTLADDLNSTQSPVQADAQFTDVPGPTGYRDAKQAGVSAYRDQRCKVLDYIEKPLLQQEWQQIPPPPSPVVPAPPLDSTNDIDKSAIKRGAGWCNFVNDADKTAFYSGVYQGVPSQMALDPIVVQKTLKTMSEDFQKAVQRMYPGETGWAVCKFNQWDSDYIQEGEEKSAEFNHILQNYKVVRTEWKPVVTSTQ